MLVLNALIYDTEVHMLILYDEKDIKKEGMQEQMQSTQAEVEETEFEANAGGGAISVKMNGKKELLSVKIKEEVVDPDDIEMLEDLIVAAVNEVIGKIDSTMEEKMGAVTGKMDLGLGG